MQNFLRACNRLRAAASIRLRMFGLAWQYGVSGGSSAHEIQQYRRLKRELDLHRLDLGTSRLDRRWRA